MFSHGWRCESVKRCGCDCASGHGLPQPPQRRCHCRCESPAKRCGSPCRCDAPAAKRCDCGCPPCRCGAAPAKRCGSPCHCDDAPAATGCDSPFRCDAPAAMRCGCDSRPSSPPVGKRCDCGCAPHDAPACGRGCGCRGEPVANGCESGSAHDASDGHAIGCVSGCDDGLKWMELRSVKSFKTSHLSRNVAPYHKP